MIRECWVLFLLPNFWEAPDKTVLSSLSLSPHVSEKKSFRSVLLICFSLYSGSNVMDRFDYVTYGMCYNKDKGDKDKGTKAMAHISFGGLLMRLHAVDGSLAKLALDDRVYCLMKKETQ